MPEHEPVIPAAPGWVAVYRHREADGTFDETRLRVIGWQRRDDDRDLYQAIVVDGRTVCPHMLVECWEDFSHFEWERRDG